MNTPRRLGWRARALVMAIGAGMCWTPIAATLGHAPDGLLGGKNWAANQAVAYTWKADQVPPGWMQAAVNAGSQDSNESRAARAAVFSWEASASSLVAYGEPTNCGTNGLACASRAGAPNSFKLWFRAQGWVNDFGTLHWCQAPASDVNGCVDAELAALHELGHVQNLAHHDDFADNSDFFDTVMHAIGRIKPKPGYNVHAFGRCDTARLQLEYDLLTWDTLVSTCLSIPTTLGLTPSATSITLGDTVKFTASLHAATGATFRSLSNDPLSGRTVILQRRSSGGLWSTIATMSPINVAGDYVAKWSPTATYEWQALLATPGGEGITGSISAVSTITVSGCNLGCPQWAPEPGVIR